MLRVRGQRLKVKAERWRAGIQKRLVRVQRWKVKNSRWELKGQKLKVYGQRQKVKVQGLKVKDQSYKSKKKAEWSKNGDRIFSQFSCDGSGYSQCSKGRSHNLLFGMVSTCVSMRLISCSANCALLVSSVLFLSLFFPPLLSCSKKGRQKYARVSLRSYSSGATIIFYPYNDSRLENSE